MKNEIKTMVNGKKMIKVPEGTESGKLLKVKGEGIKSLRGYGRSWNRGKILEKSENCNNLGYWENP
mgnify:CR=1 FL=1